MSRAGRAAGRGAAVAGQARGLEAELLQLLGARGAPRPGEPPPPPDLAAVETLARLCLRDPPEEEEEEEGEEGLENEEELLVRLGLGSLCLGFGGSPSWFWDP
ncbi:coiled-coil and C2 domain-containing protein 1A-like [Passer domesticus]|uniref:coiled-coil and C2 domain-containing protein 1A-like n=1 Tax=Passer domesticus TaxID=48849 RepID=UPI0030FF00E9